jgi:sulfide:quinone oxidoreductase
MRRRGAGPSVRAMTEHDRSAPDPDFPAIAPGPRGTPHDVVVVGGGVAALETVLALRAMAADRVSITLLAPGEELLYRPVTVAEAFDRAEARTFALDELLVAQTVRRVRDSLVEVEVDARRVHTAGGEVLDYDELVIATGARPIATLPGALTFRGREDVERLRTVLDELRSGVAGSVAFTLTRAGSWPVPLYELALLTGAHLRERGCRTRIELVTPEEEPLELFGPAAGEAIRPMLAAFAIGIRCSSLPAHVQPRRLVLAGGGSVAVDRVVTLAELQGPFVAGLPSDALGFIPVDSHGRVRGAPDVYAAGDVTAFPLKQGGLATQQADAIAELIAHRVGASISPRPFHPVLRGLLITAGAPVYMRAEPQRLPHATSVAIDVHAATSVRAGRSEASDQALWWPPAKIAGRYLAPHLATARPPALSSAPLADRGAAGRSALAEDDYRDALELVLLLADGDAAWGDLRGALSALDAADALSGGLPPEYEAKRRLWLAELGEP